MQKQDEVEGNGELEAARSICFSASKGTHLTRRACP